MPQISWMTEREEAERKRRDKAKDTPILTFGKAKSEATSEAEVETHKTPHAFCQLQKHFTALNVVQTLKENGATEVGKTIRGEAGMKESRTLDER